MPNLADCELERTDSRSRTWNKRTGRKRRTLFAPNPATITDLCNIGRVEINILSEDVLLEIFDFLVVKSYEFEAENWWRTLVHVCRTWRNVIFGSPHRLNLRLVCSDRSPVREMLDVWPPFPIAIHHFGHPKSGWGNIIAALGYNDRLCQIGLDLDPQSENVLEAMQKPFPALTHLSLYSDIDTIPVVADSFLGGSAPRLQYLQLGNVQVLGLTRLLLSATDLVYLSLQRIPHSGYISPEAIVACLSALPRLEKCYVEFESPRSRPSRGSRHLPPTRSVLPTLVKLHFLGASEYLEDLVARIDSPLLDCLEIALFHQLIFDTPQLTHFISRTPTLEVRDQVRVDFSDLHVRVTFPKISSGYHISLKLLCIQPEWQLSSIAQICTSLLPRSLIHMVERLYIRERSYSIIEWQDDIEDSQWLELLHPFTGVKKFYISKEFAPRIAPSLQELVGGRTTEVLPALKRLYLEELNPSGPFDEAIGKFIAARKLSNHPVTISKRRIAKSK